MSYWSEGVLAFHNFATGHRVGGDALTIGILDYFDDWRPAAPLLAACPPRKLHRALRTLVRASILQQSNRRPAATERAMARWSDWNPEAGFFHFSTKDVPYDPDADAMAAFLTTRLKSQPVPAIAKTYGRRRGIALPKVQPRDAFTRVLLARRSWRRFGPIPVSIDAMSALLGLTFGAQRFVDLGALGRAMLRTSPSAGGCHPIEAYVVVRRVTGVAAGVYHYGPLDHRLTRLRPASRALIGRYLCGQSWFGDASILVLLTAVFERTAWKYPFPRAYRAVLLEAGHFCQTFCLTATALGLAPFCSAALADSTIERDLGIDGVRESVLYACGAGTRPPGVEWAPWPDRPADPQVRASILRPHRRR